MKNERKTMKSGVTLVSLAITIIVIVILAGIVTVAGTDSIVNSKKTAFITEMEMIQEKVDTIYEKRKLNEENIAYYNSLGKDVSFVDQSKLDLLLEGKAQEGYRYFSKEDLKQLDLDNMNQNVIINFETRDVASINGFKIEGTVRSRLTEVPNYKANNIEYTNKNTERPTFDIEVTELSDSWLITAKNIVYNSNVAAGTLSYKKHGNKEWIIVGKNNFFEVAEHGLYDVKLTDSEGNETIAQKYIIPYVNDGLIAYYDGEWNTSLGHSNIANIWEDLSGNQNDAVFQGNTLEWNEKYYYFKNSSTNYFITNQTINLAKEDRTVEFVISMDTTNSQNFFGMGGLETGKMLDVMFSADSEFVVHNYGNNKLGLTPKEKNKIYSTSWTYSNAIGNFRINLEENKNLSYLSLDTLPTPLYIGKGIYYPYNSNNPFKLYAIRIYNRKLTDEEILKNYEIDKFRFEIVE